MDGLRRSMLVEIMGHKDPFEDESQRSQKYTITIWRYSGKFIFLILRTAHFSKLLTFICFYVDHFHRTIFWKYSLNE